MKHYTYENAFLVVSLLLLFSFIQSVSVNNDTLFEAIERTNGFIFNQLRLIKNSFPLDFQNVLEKEIKEYEYRYLSNKTEFVDYLFLMFNEYQERKELQDEQFRIDENDIKREVYDFLTQFLVLYDELSEKEQKTLISNYIQDNFTKEILKFGFENEFLFRDKGNGIEDIIENIPNFLLKKNITSFDNIKEQLHSNNNKTKVNQKFNSFLTNISNHFNSTILHDNSIPLYQKEQYIKDKTKLLSDKDIHQFSSFLEEYLHESVLDNDQFKAKYTLLHSNINYEPSFIQNEPISEENQHLMNQSMNENKKGSNGINNIIRQSDIEEDKEKEKDIIDLTGPCSSKEKELDKLIETKLSKLQAEERKVDAELAEVPEAYLTASNKSSSSKFKIMLNIIATFIKKVLTLVAKHFPFYFFKQCIPAGPLVFGCCPEAGFYPQQLYGIFTSFDKVEKFKISAKGYPDWLSSIGHEDFGKTEYYVCAQSYLTVQESSLFNMCFPMSIIPILPLNWFGLLPGDTPLCFWACLQGMLACKTSMESFGPCDSMISLQTIIMAAFIPSLRLRLVMTFGICTYIPFLIRWDLVPKWIAPEKDKEEEVNPNTFVVGMKRKDKKKVDKGNVVLKGCVDCTKDIPVKKEVKNAFEEEYENISGKGAKEEINKLKELIEVEIEELKNHNNKNKNGEYDYSNFDDDEYNEENYYKRGNKVTLSDDYGRDRLVEEPFDYLYYYNTKKYNDNNKYTYSIHKRNLFNQTNSKYLIRRKINNIKLKERVIDLDYELKIGSAIAQRDTYAEIYNGKEDSKQYQILTYGNNYNETRKKDFPFQVKQIIIQPGQLTDDASYHKMHNIRDQNVNDN